MKIYDIIEYFIIVIALLVAFGVGALSDGQVNRAIYGSTTEITTERSK